MTMAKILRNYLVCKTCQQKTKSLIQSKSCNNEKKTYVQMLTMKANEKKTSLFNSMPMETDKLIKIKKKSSLLKNYLMKLISVCGSRAV